MVNDTITKLIELSDRLDEIEKEARNNENFLKIIADSMSVAIWVKDLKHHFIFLNLICADRILKCTVEEALGLTDMDFEKDALSKVCITTDKLVIESKRVRRFIEYAIYDNGDVVWLDVTKSPLIVEGHLAGVTGVGKDITQLLSNDIKDLFKVSNYIEIEIGSRQPYVELILRRESDLG